VPPLLISPADVIAVPKATEANSFILHAPLELMARVGLLSYLGQEQLPGALDGITRLVDHYRASGDPVADTEPFEIESNGRAAQLLVASIAAGDADRVDEIAASLLPRLRPWEAVGLLGPAVVTSLAAAGHAPIGLSLLARLGSGPDAPAALPATLLRGALRSLSARPEWQLTWFDEIGVDADGDPSALYDALRTVPHLGRPGSDFIHPLMSQVQDSGVAAAVLAPVLPSQHGDGRLDVTSASRIFTRVAAWSMLHDDPEQAPYGWSHAMTMPQAVMTLAGAGVAARTAFAVAATYTVGFRAAHGLVELPEVISPGSAPNVSSADLALAASLHDDAHLVKFTLACLHAAQDDLEFRPLYLSAAQYLVEWWRANGERSAGG
jgi:hypothetical protein